MQTPVLSAACLFHYTKSFEALISILTSGLQFSVVREPYPQIAWGTSPLTALGIHRTFIDNQIVCFCDIPLTLAKSHRGQYSSYAIGLSKRWAIENGVSPVRYIHSSSPGFSGKLMELREVAYNRRQLGEEFISELIRYKRGGISGLDDLLNDQKTVIETLEEVLGDALEFIIDGEAFFKIYEGDNPLDGTPLKRFYDEREWRAASNDPDAPNLRFRWEDIRYILCATRGECEQLYDRYVEFAQNLELDDQCHVWQKLRSFEEIDEDY